MNELKFQYEPNVRKNTLDNANKHNDSFVEDLKIAIVMGMVYTDICLYEGHQVSSDNGSVSF